MIPALTRSALLETAFCDIPTQVGTLTLRPLSAGSFTLLGRLKNPMMTGAADGQEIDQSTMFAAVIQYIWVHSADLALVSSIVTADDIPAGDLSELGFQITLGQALAFLEGYKNCAARMAASLAEVEDDDAPGKPATETPVPAPVGSPASSTPSAPRVRLPVNVISYGACPSSEPSPTSTPPMSPAEPPADGLVLPSLTPPMPPPPP